MREDRSWCRRRFVNRALYGFIKINRLLLCNAEFWSTADFVCVLLSLCTAEKCVERLGHLLFSFNMMFAYTFLKI
jgi:hypothetical protein